MSRGNINKRYIRRRKSWLQRNIGWLIAIVVVAILSICGIAFGIKTVIASGSNHKSSQANNNVAVSTQTQIAPENIQWINEEEPANTTVNYIPPSNVSLPYFIKVNRAMCCVTVYGIDDSGSYTIPVKAFACSVGREGEETIVGENYTTTDKYVWRLMVDYTYGHFAFRINGGYLFHSVPFYTASSDSLETEEFNKLGSPASLGCVRMCVADVKWLYDNCPSGTKVTIYDDATTAGPLGKPDTIKIPVDSVNAGWDPTDPDASNPWNKSSAKIVGAKDITTKVGIKVDIKYGVTATDTCNNDITSKLVTVGKYTFDQVGQYDIKYVVTDAIGSKAEVTVKLNVIN